MSDLTLLDSNQHASLRLLPNSGVKFAAEQHILPLRAEEIGKAASSFPVFMTRNTHSGDWAFSGVTSLEVSRNLFVADNQWQATYTPHIVQTYPFYLLATGQDDQYAMAFDPQSEDFSETEGEPLFDESGKTAPWVTTLGNQLQAHLQANYQTHMFATALGDAGLTKEIGVHVAYEDDTVQTIAGLHTIDEDKLQALDAAMLAEFNQKGYLTPIYAMLLSIFQLNTLVRRHNLVAVTTEGKAAGQKTVRQVKLEVARDAGAAGHVV